MSEEQWALEPHPVQFVSRENAEQEVLRWLLRDGVHEDSWPRIVSVQLAGRTFPEVRLYR